jgi:hypothetical protein
MTLSGPIGSRNRQTSARSQGFLAGEFGGLVKPAPPDDKLAQVLSGKEHC